MKATKRSWNVTTHIVWPLICFAAGISISVSMLGGLDRNQNSQNQDPRLVDMMGRVNDLELTVKDLEDQLASAKMLSNRLEAEAGKATPCQEPEIDGAANKEAEEEWKQLVDGKTAGETAVMWSKVGKWQSTQLEPLSFLNKYDIGFVVTICVFL